jgi:hypothetical protein
MEEPVARDRTVGVAMTKSDRVLGVFAGTAMVVGGVLSLDGNRWGFLLVSLAAAFLAVVAFLAARRHFG